MLHAGHRPEGGALCVRAIIVTRRTRPRAAPQRTRPGRAGRGRGPPSRRDRDRTEWAARPPERVRRRVSAPRCWAISQVDSMTRRAGRLSNGRLRKGSHVVRHGSDNPGRSFFRRAVPTSPRRRVGAIKRHGFRVTRNAASLWSSSTRSFMATEVSRHRPFTTPLIATGAGPGLLDRIALSPEARARAPRGQTAHDVLMPRGGARSSYIAVTPALLIRSESGAGHAEPHLVHPDVPHRQHLGANRFARGESGAGRVQPRVGRWGVSRAVSDRGGTTRGRRVTRGAGGPWP